MKPVVWWKLFVPVLFVGLAATVGWAVLRAHHFSVRLVSFAFVPAKDGASIPGSERYPGEDALAVRFESDMNLMRLAEIRQLQFRCAIDGSQLDDGSFFGMIFPDLADRRWQNDIAQHACEPKQYIARVRLWPAAMMPNRNTFYRELLRGRYDQLRCQVVGVMMAPGFYYSNEMVVPGDVVRRAVADALAK